MQVPDGFSAFVDGQSTRLLRSAWVLTGDWATAEDLLQTALAVAWQKWEQIARVDAPEVYVRKVMITTYLRWQRRRWVHEVPTGQLPDKEQAIEPDRAELRWLLLDTLQRLPPRQRAVIALRYLDDLPEARVAEILGCSVGTVKAHASKAIARLRTAPGLANIMPGGTQ